jgi:hypothetical protein
MESMSEEEQLQRALEMSKAESSGHAKAPGTPPGAVDSSKGEGGVSQGQSNMPMASGGLPPRNVQQSAPHGSSGGLPTRPEDSGQSVPKLSLDTAQRRIPMPEQPAIPQRGYDVHLGTECESEIDRLVKERLEGAYSNRVYANRTFKGNGKYHNSWVGRCDGSVREAAWTVLETISWSGQALVGHASSAAGHVGSACSRVVKATPIYIGGEDDEYDDGYDLYGHNLPPHVLTKQDEEFKDFISAPLAVSASSASPQRPPAQTSQLPDQRGAQGLAAPPEKMPEPSKGGGSSARQQPSASGGQKGQNDRGSALSVSSAMTSSAAQLLGGLGQGNLSAQRQKATSSSNRPIPEEEESVPASSSEAYQKQAAPKASSGRTAKGGETQSVLGSSVGMTSSAAAALGSLTAKGGNQRRAEDTQSTLGQSAAKTSGDNSGRQRKAPASVVSGMQNSTSNSSALLGPLLQGGQQRRKQGGDNASVLA